MTAETLPPAAKSRLSWVAARVVLCAFLNCAGWGLSALHQLNRGGYAVLFALAVAVFVAWHRRSGARLPPGFSFARFRRPFPLAFLILDALAMNNFVLEKNPSNPVAAAPGPS